MDAGTLEELQRTQLFRTETVCDLLVKMISFSDCPGVVWIQSGPHAALCASREPSAISLDQSADGRSYFASLSCFSVKV